MKNLSKVLLSLLLVTALFLTACGGQNTSDDSSDASNDTNQATEESNDANQDAEEDEAQEPEENSDAEENTDAEENEDAESADVYNGTEGKITVYISGPEKMINKLEETFEKTHGDVIDIYHAGCGPLRQKVWTEAEAGNVHADVFWGSNPLIYYVLQDKGLLDEYKSNEEESFMDEYKVSDANFMITNARYEVLVYGKQSLDKENAPKAYNDLLDAKFDGKVAFTDLSQSSTAFALCTALWEMNDRKMDYFQGLKDNNALIVPKSKSVAEKIQSGEIEAGIVPHDAIFRLNKKAKKEGFESNLAFTWPSEGAIQIERPIAIIKNDARPEKNQEIAEQFVDFVLSKEAQTIMTNFGFKSVRTDVDAVQGIPEDMEYTKINWKDAIDSEQLLRDEFKKIMSGNN